MLVHETDETGVKAVQMSLQMLCLYSELLSASGVPAFNRDLSREVKRLGG